MRRQPRRLQLIANKTKLATNYANCAKTTPGQGVSDKEKAFARKPGSCCSACGVASVVGQGGRKETDAKPQAEQQDKHFSSPFPAPLSFRFRGIRAIRGKTAFVAGGL
jgi:hypothetical protein